jgi:hypothetical protein
MTAASGIAQSLAYINWVVLASLAVGAFGVVAIARLRTDATRGYVGFMAATAAALGGLAFLADLALPSPDGLAIAPGRSLDVPRRAALGAFAVIAAGYVVVVARRERGPALALGGVAAGGAALVFAAAGWGRGAGDAVGLAIHLLVLAAATGGVLAAMVLGHWYLVTPRLSERPLVLITRLLTAVVALQVLLFATSVVTGLGTGLAPFAPLVGGAAVFVWLRLAFGLIFPLVLTAMAHRTARTRSMESATGLLYIDTAAILAGTIVAAGLRFGAGLIV